MIFKEAYSILCTLFIISLELIQYTNASCATFEFQCLDGRCIPKSWLCDGTPDCQTQEDETHPHCDRHNNVNSSCFGNQPDCMHQGHFRCIRHEWLCDGHRDCDDGQDELNCTSIVSGRGGCGVAEYSCISGGCVPRDQICNGNFDCMDGSDEADEICGRNRNIFSNAIAEGTELNQGRNGTSNGTVSIHETGPTKGSMPKTTELQKRTKIVLTTITTTTPLPSSTTTTIIGNPLLFFENPLFSLFGVTSRHEIPATPVATSTPPPTRRSSAHRAIVFKVAETPFPTLITSEPLKTTGKSKTLVPNFISSKKIELPVTQPEARKENTHVASTTQNPTLFPLLKPLENIIVGVMGAKKKHGVTDKPVPEIRRAPAKDSVNTVHDYEMMETTGAEVSERLRSPNGTATISELENSNVVTDSKEFRTNRAKVFREKSGPGTVEDADMLNLTSSNLPYYPAPAASRPVRYVKGVPIKPYKIRYDVKSLEKIQRD